MGEDCGSGEFEDYGDCAGIVQDIIWDIENLEEWLIELQNLGYPVESAMERTKDARHTMYLLKSELSTKSKLYDDEIYEKHFKK